MIKENRQRGGGLRTFLAFAFGATVGSVTALLYAPASGEVTRKRLAMKALRPGGYLAAFSCSHHIDFDLFQKVLFAAVLDAGRQAQIVLRFGPDIDHPVSMDHPEGDYLKGLFLRVL